MTKKKEIRPLQILLPYLLLGVVVYLQGLTDDQERERDKKQDDVQLALVEWEASMENYQQALDLRDDCIDDVNGRNNMIANWKFFINYVRPINPDSANAFEKQFDAQPNNQPKTIERDCKEFPVPEKPEPHAILIEEGVIRE